MNLLFLLAPAGTGALDTASVQTVAQVRLLTLADDAQPLDSAAPLSAETIWKRIQSHPITKPWIRLRTASSQAAPVSGPVTIQ